MNFPWKICNTFAVILCFLNSFPLRVNAEAAVDSSDYYEILGVARDADNREIRKAFKKLALRMHPDKNAADPAAHEKFVKINRVYEVLKDEDLRKKYDLHGEAGLDGNKGRGRQYESWSFYNQNFGIYDDDEEIITLDGYHDFQQSVQKSQDVWFINFYSARCGHCHELAPAWRELAKELVGVVRIGAINCLDDWMLCRNLGIRSYPSLLFYPQGKRYDGERDVGSMMKAALREARAKLTNHVQLILANVDLVSKEPARARLPWLVTFCGLDNDCLHKTARLKLSAILNGLASVAHVDCDMEATLCATLVRGKLPSAEGGEPQQDPLQFQGGTLFFPAGTFNVEGTRKDSDKVRVVTALDAQEIVREVLDYFPAQAGLSASDFEAVQAKLAAGQAATSQLVYFHGDARSFARAKSALSEIDLRRLPVALGEHRITSGTFNCSTDKTHADLCRKHGVTKLPTAALYKRNKAGYEIYHGRMTSQDVVQFALEAATSVVQVLTEDNFPPGHLADTPGGTHWWFVDFFTPWCPPCMQLLPEIKTVSHEVVTRGWPVRFGTVDCTAQQALCARHAVRSYPAMVMFHPATGDTSNRFTGFHGAHEVLDFIESALDPRVVVLDADTFAAEVGGRDRDLLWVVDFYNPHCGPCQQLMPEWRKLAKKLANNNYVKVGSVDCTQNPQVCNAEGVQGYPSIRLYPRGRGGTTHFSSYNNWMRNADSLFSWVFEYLPSVAVKLDGQRFTKEVLGDGQPWLVDFYAPWCGHCRTFAPTFELVAQTLNKTLKAGKVNCDVEKRACQAAGVRAYPTVKLYRGGRGTDIDSYRHDDIVNIVRSRMPRPAAARATSSTTSAKDEL